MSCPFLLPSWRHPDPTREASLRFYTSEEAPGLLPNTANIPLWPKIHDQTSKYWPVVSALQLRWWQLGMSWYHTQPWYEGRIKYEAGSENIKRKHERMLCKAGFFEICWKTEGEIRKVFSFPLWDFSVLPCDGGSVGTDPSWVISITCTAFS